MKLKSANFQNYRCFSDFSIELHPELNVFVGENGAGKTAAIEGIVAALSVLNRALGATANGPTNKDVKRTDNGGVEISGYVRCYLTENHLPLLVKFQPNLEKTEETQAIALYESPELAFPNLANNITRNPESKATLPVYAYYPTSRHLTTLQSVSTNTRKSFGRIDSLNSSGSAFTDYGYVVDWLYDLYVAELIAHDNDDNDTKISNERDTINRAIKQVIPEVSSIGFTKKSPRKLLLKWTNKDGDIEDRLVSQLSDGYRMMLTLVIDFARRLVQANPHLPDPLASEAVLIIDEIDLHLHPSWQQRIIADLRKAFPNTQLIVATHSPQVISSVQPDNVFIFSDGQYEHAIGQHTYGVESYRVLEDIFGVSPVPEIEEITALKQKYQSAIENGEGESTAAVALRQNLETHIGKISPFMINARAEILRRKRKAG